MSTITPNNNLSIAETYYQHLLKKEFESMAQCLHPKVEFAGPLAKISEKNAIVEAAKNLSTILEKIEIQSRFSSGNQIMLVYDFVFPKPIGQLRAAVLMEFKEQLISKIELFYDGRPFEEKKEEIFSKK